MNEYTLLFGGNKGNVIDIFNKGLNLLLEEEIEIVKKSSIYQTAAWGVENQPSFLNMAIVIKSNKTPEKMLITCQKIEKKCGRNRQEEKRWGERSLDIDIIFCEQRIIDLPQLQIPHPLMHKRRFVLVPINDIVPRFNHPIMQLSVNQLLKGCKDDLPVVKV